MFNEEARGEGATPLHPTLRPPPHTLRPKPQTPQHTPHTLHQKPHTLHLELQTQNTKHPYPNPKTQFFIRHPTFQATQTLLLLEPYSLAAAASLDVFEGMRGYRRRQGFEGCCQRVPAQGRLAPLSLSVSLSLTLSLSDSLSLSLSAIQVLQATGFRGLQPASRGGGAPGLHPTLYSYILHPTLHAPHPTPGLLTLWGGRLRSSEEDPNPYPRNP